MSMFNKKITAILIVLLLVIISVVLEFGCRGKRDGTSRRERGKPAAQQQTQELQPSQGPNDPELQMWEMVKNSDNVQDVEDFLASYPKGKFVPAANMKLKQLKRQQGTDAPAPSISAPQLPNKD